MNRGFPSFLAGKTNFHFFVVFVNGRSKDVLNSKSDGNSFIIRSRSFSKDQLYNNSLI